MTRDTSFLVEYMDRLTVSLKGLDGLKRDYVSGRIELDEFERLLGYVFEAER